jgi:dTDP-3,4-didehydro-2,6-dideoxy-alpha-D-glucose 3-reductase
LKSSFGFPPFPDKNNIRYKKELGGGALFDAGAYPIKIAQEFIGNDLTIRAAKLSIDKELEVDLGGGGFVEQVKGNLFAEISFGFDNFYQCSIEIWGSKGKLSTNRIFTAKADYNPVINIETAEGLVEKELPPDNAYKNMLQHFSNVIADPALREYEYIQNKNQARLIDEFRKQAF